MKKKFKFKKLKLDSKLAKIFISAAEGLILCIALAFLGGLIFYLGDFDFEKAFAYSIAVYVVSSFSCGYFQARKLKEKGMAAGALSGAVFFLFCMIIALTKGSDPSLDALYKLGICLLSGAIGGILGVNKRNRKKLKSKK